MVVAVDSKQSAKWWKSSPELSPRVEQRVATQPNNVGAKELDPIDSKLSSMVRSCSHQLKAIGQTVEAVQNCQQRRAAGRYSTHFKLSNAIHGCSRRLKAIGQMMEEQSRIV
jgi:hypothetical protein